MKLAEMIIATFIAAFITSISQTAFCQSRVQLDLDAKEKFMNLNFTAGGKGMMLVPDMIELQEMSAKVPGLKHIMLDRASTEWGFNVVNDKIVGVFNVPYKNMSLGVLGCVGCHSGKAAGLFIPGLGNKNIDILKVGQDVNWIENLYVKMKLKRRNDETYKEIRDTALEFSKLLADEKLANFSQGLVPVSFVRTWFYKQAGKPWPEDMARGSVKIPALWGYEEKRKIGQFCDGFGNGDLPGWAIAVELTAGQTPENVRTYVKKIEEAEHLFSYFLPVAYPFEINNTKASSGKQVYQKNCAGCHGDYQKDSEGLPIFEAPKWFPVQVVGTDADRLRANTEEFRDLVAGNPLNDILKATTLGDGYFAPRLVGIWSRFPYLHNGSVPSVRALLTKPELRPKTFSLKNAGEKERFDQSDLGLTLVDRPRSDRSLFDSRLKGHSNQGHDFGTSLPSSDKDALIEYLKTL